MLDKDEEYIPQVITVMSDENKHAELLAEDEEEDFLDEGRSSRIRKYVHTYLSKLDYLLLYLRKLNQKSNFELTLR